MRKNSKKKGNRGENELAKMLCERFGEGSFKRTPSSGAYTGGINREKAEYLPWEAKITLASDIITPSDFNFIIEHKFYQEVNFWNLFSGNSQWLEWLTQATEDANFVNKEPMVIVKYNRHPRISILRTSYLVDQLNKLDYFSIWGILDKNAVNKSSIPKLHWEPLESGTPYSVVMLKDLMELPEEFWFTKEKGQ